MQEKVINELNALLKGEDMAVEAYERFIQEVEEENIKRELQDIQQEHRRHAGELAKRIQTLGGSPQYGTGFAGFMANAKIAIQSRGMDTVDILKRAYDGEDKGIAMAEEIVKGDLDEESREMVNRMLSEDHGHLKRMVTLIADFENKH